MNKLLVLSTLLLLPAACGDDDGGTTPGTDGGPGSAPSCEGAQPLELGRCQTSAGADCTGASGEDVGFAPVGSSMPLVVGPQGYTMLVFSVRATGITPGDSADRYPVVEFIILDESDGRRQVAVYRERKPFVEDATMPGAYLNGEQLWVVTATRVSFDLDGHSLHAVATLRDQNDEYRCGTASFTVHR